MASSPTPCPLTVAAPTTLHRETAHRVTPTQAHLERIVEARVYRLRLCVLLPHARSPLQLQDRVPIAGQSAPRCVYQLLRKEGGWGEEEISPL